MKIKHLSLEGFRAHALLEVSFDPEHTVLVGDNGVGKSTIGLAVDRVIRQVARPNDDLIDQMDYRYGRRQPLKLLLRTELPKDLRYDFEKALTRGLSPEHSGRWRKHVQAYPDELAIEVLRPSTAPYTIQWGDLFFFASYAAADKSQVATAAAYAWQDRLKRHLDETDSYEKIIQALSTNRFDVGSDISAGVNREMSSFRMIQEFRTKSSDQKTGAIEAPTGSDTASVLFNLKNHVALRERQRYDRIRESFSQIFPQYDIVAVERTPGSGQPDIQFLDRQGRSLPLGSISAGTQQMLTLLTNLVGRPGLIVFIEHPEQHLHAHSSRFVADLIRQSSKSSQIIVATHDVAFLHPSDASSVRRIWGGLEAPGLAAGLPSGLSGTDLGRIETALRAPSARELFFARFVILVEDESQEAFLRGVARVLGHNLDGRSVSVFQVGGHDGFGPYVKLLRAFKIPFMALRDKPWGPTEDSSVFQSLGMELEPFLDSKGLETQRRQVIAEHGSSKRRVAGILAGVLGPEQIPGIFAKILETAMANSTGLPAVEPS